MKKKTASSTLYFIFFFVIFLAFCAFAVDGTLTLTYRSKLQNATEMAALAGASEFTYDLSAQDSDIITKVQNEATDTFNLLRGDSLQTASVQAVDIDTGARTVTLTTKVISQPFFLSFLGVNGITLEAKASAQSETLPVTANYSGVNWITKKAAYFSDILSKNLNFNDTAILEPLGGGSNASYISAGNVNFNLISGEESKPLSLGPGGFITIKLPAPIVDKPGPDLSVVEVGDAVEGYMVFAGLDNDPANPYVNKDDRGGEISWVNISCTGTSDSGLGSSAYQQAENTQLPTSTQDKFYGSGSFDISKTCASGFRGVSMAKYIRIIDDNSESAFIKGSYTMVYGESSSPTPGADIDSVQILNHVKLK